MTEFITSQPPMILAILLGAAIGEVIGQAIFWTGSILTHKWIERTRRRRWEIPKCTIPKNTVTSSQSSDDTTPGSGSANAVSTSERETEDSTSDTARTSTPS